MSRRPEFHKLLVDFLGSGHVYFQPPESVKLSYPCIIYSLDNFDVRHANNQLYLGKDRYAVTLISKDPDWDKVRELLGWQYCSFNRHFTVDNLNHWTYEIYY